MRTDEIGTDIKSFAVAGDGFIQFPEIPERTTKIAKRIGGIGFDVEGLAVAGDGFIQFSEVMERNAKVAMCIGKIGIDVESPRHEINSVFIFSFLVGNYTKKMQRFRIIRIQI